MADAEEGRVSAGRGRRAARRGRARRHHLAARAWCGCVPHRRVSEDQLSRRDLDGDHPDLSLLPVAAVHGRTRRDAVRRARGHVQAGADDRADGAALRIPFRVAGRRRCIHGDRLFADALGFLFHHAGVHDERAGTGDRIRPASIVDAVAGHPRGDCGDRRDSRRGHVGAGGHDPDELSDADFDHHRRAGDSRPDACGSARHTVKQEAHRGAGGRLDRSSQRRDDLCRGRHYRRRRHADGPRIEILRHRHRFCRRQPADDSDLHIAGGLDHRPRGSGHGLVHHLRGDRRAGADQAGRA